MLTGKTEQQFIDWVFNKYNICIDYGFPDGYPEVCQLALMQEFFREALGINICPFIDLKKMLWWANIIQNDKPKYFEWGARENKSYSEALKAAISKANDINNGR